ncbi:MAG: carboxypeptidase regulatory-like domain-containing protein [Fibrobacteria bacterium]|nr:carboxypeptidase regulatory-like domain-containing protein [Fibrobacteria bacterium]
MTPRRTATLLSSLGAGILALGCNGVMSAGGSDEIDTSVNRVAVDRQGTPVAGARVALIPAGDSSGKALAVSAADSAGILPGFRVPDGYYGMILRDPGDSIGRFVDSLRISSGLLPHGRDTLLALGRIRGVVQVAPDHSPAMVTMGLIGTDILANVLVDGSFSIDLVPGGIYTLAAMPSMDGYAPLYQRLQLEDGQTLALPDTLKIPFSGFPAPRGILVGQDSGTGNVTVTWNRVDHPDLYGYLLEALEGGTVKRSRFLQDTSWVDSLGLDWEDMDFFGPWADRKVVYRIASRSRSGLEDAPSAASEFVAHPPSWTRGLKPVQVRIDPLSETKAEISWTRLNHPALTGWIVERWRGDTMDCRGEVSDTVWMDSACPLRGWKKIDSGAEYRSEGVYAGESTSYRLLAKHGEDRTPENLSGASLPPPMEPTFSGLPEGVWETTGSPRLAWQTRQIRVAGPWLMQVFGASSFREDQDEIRAISKDGRSWENTSLEGIPVAQEDSLWILRPAADSMGIVWSRRIGPNAWSVDSLRLPFALTHICWAIRNSDGFALGAEERPRPGYGSNFRHVVVTEDGWFTKDSSMDHMYPDHVSPLVLPTLGGGYNVLNGSAFPEGSAIYHVDRLSAVPMMNQGIRVGITSGAPIGPWGGLSRSLFWNTDEGGWSRPSPPWKLALIDSTGNGRVVRLPEGAEQPAVRGNELWVPVGDSLWKGTIVMK